MKCVLKWLVPALVVFTAVQPRAAIIDGQHYISLEGWARSEGLHTTWLAAREVQVSGRAGRMVLAINSADAEIDGVHVRLSYPLAGARGDALISVLDLDTTVRPLLFVRRAPDDPVRTICLDPGHGGRDTGNRVHDGSWRNEKTYTLALALELRRQLRAAGFRVILTRNRDVYVPLPERPAMANNAGADLFISLHFNATTMDRRGVEGPETYCITPIGAPSSNAQGETGNDGPTAQNQFGGSGLLLAFEMEKSLVQNLHVPDRGVRHARYAVLRDARMPAILIEGGYMTHPIEGPRIFSAAYRGQMAAAMVKGILGYEKLIGAVSAPAPLTGPHPKPQPVLVREPLLRFSSPRNSGD
ncbi:MAG: N-acetylmuramoyl-L-alanine amidase [Verrucomicrobia bacterium]|nr:N-acetylmuramoyl-L-alanine amidase [Verrucomicrobiota bacterium]MDE3099959.1 N-acetylmuramoyl-L-alanine amidase [Verrucomicrobiota bacterium]